MEREFTIDGERFVVNELARAPFTAETFRTGLAAVVDANGVNWVRFPPHAKLMSPMSAERVASVLNKEWGNG